MRKQSPERCHHGVLLVGREHRCLECELLWETTQLEIAQHGVEKHKRRIAKLKAERREEIAAISRTCGDA